jgi:PAS domain S-box-containing protein
MIFKRKRKRNRQYSVLDFLSNPSSLFDHERYLYIKKETEEYLVVPLKVITFLIAISGLFAMVFEVIHASEYSFQIYLTRLLATLVAFVILVILHTRHALRSPVLLVHILLLSIIASSGYMIILLPKTLIPNSQIVGLMIFTSALFLSWEVKNQIIVAIYYNIVFAAAILFNKKEIYFLPNMFESLLFVIFLSLISVVGSAVNFKLRSELAEKSYKIKQSAKKYRSIIENSIEGIFQSTPSGRFVTVNSSLIKLLGYDSVDEIRKLDIGKNVYANPKDREMVIKLLKEKGEIKNYQLRLKRKDGKDIFVKINDRVVKDEDENRYLFEGSIHDITEQVILEEEKRKATEQLKAEKAKSDILAKEALKSSEIKSQFLANMSHEIRTPMNGVIGFLTLIEQGTYRTQNELKDLVASARNSAETLLELINNILDFSKIEAGKLELNEVPFNMRDILNEAIGTIITLANEKKLEMKIDIETGAHLHLLGDSTRILQIYINLLSNAVKFTNKGHVKISISSEKLEEDKVKITSFVEDTGLGIPNERIKYLFQPFSQLDGSYTRKFGGTGLGLAICKELVTMMNGSIKVESQHNIGSRFTFSIILKIQKQSSLIGALKSKVTPSDLEQRKLVESQLFAAEFTSQRNKFNILLAEDNAVNQKVALKILHTAGLQAVAVNNGAEAVTAIQSDKKYDLILMDIQMPEVDGFTATHQIREMGDYGYSIPIIAMTAHAMSGDKDKCIAAGMNDYLTKPIRTDELIATIDKWLNIKVDPLKIASIQEYSPMDDIFDRKHFSSISMDNPEFQKELLTTFISDTTKRIERLESFIRESNFSKITSESHTIKGASYSVGAKLMGDEAKEIEVAAKQNNLTVVLERLTNLKKAFEDTAQLVQEFIV